jgi:hypothetical protein
LGSWNCVISHGIAHEFGKTTWLYPPITVDGKTMTVNLGLTPIDGDVALNERQMIIQCAGKRSCQIVYGDA